MTEQTDPPFQPGDHADARVSQRFHARAAHILALPYCDPFLEQIVAAAEDTYGAFIRDLAHLVEHHQRIAHRLTRWVEETESGP